MYLFSKRIKCLSCGKNLRGIKERNKSKYVCSTYHKTRNCVRKVVEEELIVDLVNEHKKIQLNRPELYNLFHVEQAIEDYVKNITFNPDTNELTIYYVDGTKSYFSDKQQTYWSLGMT